MLYQLWGFQLTLQQSSSLVLIILVFIQSRTEHCQYSFDPGSPAPTPSTFRFGDFQAFCSHFIEGLGSPSFLRGSCVTCALWHGLGFVYHWP